MTLVTIMVSGKTGRDTDMASCTFLTAPITVGYSTMIWRVEEAF